MSDSEITLYGVERSGHVHRVALLLRMLELPYRYPYPSVRAWLARVEKLPRFVPMFAFPIPVANTPTG